MKHEHFKVFKIEENTSTRSIDFESNEELKAFLSSAINPKSISIPDEGLLCIGYTVSGRTHHHKLVQVTFDTGDLVSKGMETLLETAAASLQGVICQDVKVGDTMGEALIITFLVSTDPV